MTGLLEESMTPGYFRLIKQQLSRIRHAGRSDIRWPELVVDIGLQLRFSWIRYGVKMLELFCKWLETLEHSSIIDDERSTFSVIWSKDLSLVLEKLVSHPTDQVYDGSPSLELVISDLEGMIVQSKQLIQGWPSNPIYKSSLFQQMQDFVRRIPPPYEVLDTNIKFLESAFTQLNMDLDEQENLPFMNFASSYANSVAWLTCLYWAKGDRNNEIASEILFDMSHKFIPYAYDIIPFFAYNITLDTVDVSNFFRIGELVGRLVDFFFDHLAEVLGDDFVFLRDRLMFLFTFLADPPCENAAEEDVIRSDIYAILHEDEYLLSNFKEIDKDFQHQKMLFSAFMKRIDTVNDKIRQLHSGGSSDSRITLELEKMAYNYIPPLHREISCLQISWLQISWRKLTRVGDIKQCKMGLRFLRMSFLWLETWDDTDEEIKLKLSSVITSFQGTWGQEEEMGHLVHRFRREQKVFWVCQEEYWEMYRLLDELEAKIRRSTIEIKAWCLELFHLRIRYKTLTSYKILKFVDSILDNLNDLVSYRASKIILFMKQIETLEGKLIFLKNLLKLAVNCRHCQELGEFKIFVQAFAHDAARLSILYWTQHDANAMSTSDETNYMLSQLLQKIKPTTPNVARLYFGILKSICAHRSDSHIFGRTAFSFVQLLLEDLATHLRADDLQILQDNIVFLLSFLNDPPPDQNGAELLCSQIDLLFWKDLYSLTPFHEGGFSAKKASLSDFMIKIEVINARIRCNYCEFPDSSEYNFPKVIPPQFLDFLSKKLKSLMDKMNSDRKYVPFVKYKFMRIEKQLASLSPFLVRIFDFQNETWLQVVNVLYLTEYVIMSSISSLFVFDHSFWYHMAYLSKVVYELEAVKAKLVTIKLENNAIGFVSEVAQRSQLSEIDEIVVGFEDEKEEIIGMLTCGSKALEIVSIVGMGGLGKTTLAKKIFGSLSVKSHFSVLAFYSVSAVLNTRQLLLDIISEIKGGDDKRLDMTNDDLAQELRQYLSRQRYLVVLDDIWDVSAWNEVSRSFPDHENGSRVIFTSRSHEVADKCGIKCITYKLRLMSEIESLELFQKKVFRNDVSPPYLHEIGKRIAKNCKGLPLAIVVIGGLLARTEKSLKWWSEVEQGLAYYLSKEGCMDILELSYKHLPENLKPCFIYLGAFPEDSLISVKHVIQLWIAEGFVEKENVATRYIDDLIDRSLIIVGERSSSGGIKRFCVHDLVRELCVTKCQDGNFFERNHGIASSSTSSHSIQNTYRFSMQREDDTVAAGSSLSNARTLLCNFSSKLGIYCKTHPRKFRLLQVLDKLDWGAFEHNSLIHLRYIHVRINLSQAYMLSLTSNLGNITYLQLSNTGNRYILPDTFWRMKSLRNVKLDQCFLIFPDDEEENEECSDQILDKVVSFSKPVLCTHKDIKRLHQRLPALQKLSCYIRGEEGSLFDFPWELESLKLFGEIWPSYRMRNMKFPSTLKELELKYFSLQNGTCLSAIAEKLHLLEVLKLNNLRLLGSEKLETEDLVFHNLIFFELDCYDLKEWNTSPESFPLLEQLVICCHKDLKELSPYFGEMSTLKRIDGTLSSEAACSALRIKEQLEELGTQVELSFSTYVSDDDDDDDDDDCND